MQSRLKAHGDAASTHLASRCIETQKREALYTIRCKFSIGALYLDASATGCEGWALHLDAASLSRHETRRSKCARAPSGYTTRARAKRLPRARVPSGYHGHACQAATTRSRAKVAAGPRVRAPSGYHAPLTERLSAQGAKHNKIRIRYPQHYIDFFLCAQSCSCVHSPAVASVRSMKVAMLRLPVKNIVCSRSMLGRVRCFLV